MIEVEALDAEQFCCNAVDLNRQVFMNGASEALQARLREAGFAPVITPLSEFMKAGGSAKCLTLKLREER
jgi:N-dimethylarginine dimethylaminohydrolase